MYMLGKCDRKYILNSQIQEMEYYQYIYQTMKESDSLKKTGHHNGPCIPGGRRLFVSVAGNFYPCEKVTEGPGMRIGNIEEGIDIDASKKVVKYRSCYSRTMQGLLGFKIVWSMRSKVYRKWRDIMQEKNYINVYSPNKWQ